MTASVSSTKARTAVSRQNSDVKHKICVNKKKKKKKLDRYAKSYRGENSSVIHDTIPLSSLLLAVSSSEAIPSHSEKAYVSYRIMENFR